MRLILASSSPRRKEIFGLLGLGFESLDPGVDERFDSKRSASEEAVHWAVEKARSVAAGRSDALVIASDTLIDLDGEKIGKPSGHEEAFRMLRRLAGRDHRVVTAVAAAGPGPGERTAVEEAAVSMRTVHDEILMRYAFTPEPLDKAGAYSIQGTAGQWVERVEGDYLAVVGLPLRPVAAFLAGAGIAPPVDVETVYRNMDYRNWKDYA